MTSGLFSQWCNVPGTGPARRMDGRFKLAWFLEADSEQEVYGSNCPKGYLSATWAVKSRRFLALCDCDPTVALAAPVDQTHIGFS